jgi:hypothetical protein
MRHFGGHANTFNQCRMRMDGLAYVDRVGAHFDRQRNLANHVTGMRSDNTAADDAVRGFVKQQFGKAFVAAIGNGPA